jgi:hypothetical protein
MILTLTAPIPKISTPRRKNCFRYSPRTNGRTTAVVSLFERLNRGRPPPTRKAQEPSPAQKLLDWLQHWSKPTVSARDICIYGPNAIRDRQRAIDSAEILVKNGWLVPIKTRRHDMHEWQIVRKPIIHPTVATEAVE